MNDVHEVTFDQMDASGLPIWGGGCRCGWSSLGETSEGVLRAINQHLEEIPAG